LNELLPEKLAMEEMGPWQLSGPMLVFNPFHGYGAFDLPNTRIATKFFNKFQ
jgi:hypothetical protein